MVRSESTRGAAVAILALLAVAACDAGEDGPSEAPLVYMSHTPAASPAVSFTAGSYVVGKDIALGRYSANADACQWIQRDSTGAILDRSGPDRPTQVLTLSATDSELVVSGPNCTFTRLP